MKNRWTRSAIALLAGISVGACDEGPSANGGDPRVSILLTDAPGDVAEARIVIDEISIHAGDEGERIVLSTDPWEGDLLELQNTFATLVDDVEIPAGTYSQVRLVISEGCIRTEGGDVFATTGFDACGAATGRLQMPSYAQSGLKINLPPDAEVQSEGRTIVLLDFNVAESFGAERGASNMWVMTPVIRATNFEVSSGLSVTLAVADSVTLPDSVELTDFGFSIDGEAPVGVTDAGLALFQLLIPGAHELDLVVPQGWTVTTDPELPYAFDLASDTDLELDFTITSIAEAPADTASGS